MAARILVDINTLQSARTKYTSSKTKATTALNTVDKAVNSLSSVWQGSGATAFRTRYNSLKKNLDNTEKLMTDALKDLQTAINETTTMESTAQSAANKLGVGDANYY